MRIGILGTGTITSAVVHGIAADGHQITVSERGTDKSAALAKTYENVTVADNQTVLDNTDIVFLGLIAEAAPAILSALTFRSDQRIITVMAGATLEEADDMVSPATAAAIMMPFPSIATGGSAIMMQGDADLIGTLFGARNQIFELRSAEEMSAYLCAQAVLSPVARMVDDAARWLAARVEDQAQGEMFLRHLVTSGLEASTAASLIEALNTPGGYNQRLRQHMEAAGTGATLNEGLTKLETGS